MIGRIRRNRSRLARRFFHCSRPTARLLGILLAAVGWTVSVGCTAYQFGPSTLFRPDIRTVHVPIARNDTFRHDLGVRLTEAVVKAIERRSLMKVTGDPLADSTLRCRVTSETKRVLTETESDDPRALDAVITVRADWISRNGEVLLQNAIASSEDLTVLFAQDARFVPEAGQSIDTATQEVIDALAERIVSQMEIRW